MLSERHRRVLEAVTRLESGESHVINSGDAEECENLGLVKKQPDGRWRLTDRGRKKLSSSKDNS